MNSEQKEKKPFSVKEFFKSTAFKCIAVLLIIVLVSGILLTFCNALFYVSDQDKLDRVLSNIYGESVETTPFEKEDMVVEFDNGTINSAYQVTDSSDYIINSSGTGGFYGKVTCWVVVEVKDNAVSGIRRVVLEGADNDKEYTSHISEDKYNYFSDSFSEEGFTVNDWKNDSLHGGATPTSTMTAIVNSVNTALEFVRTQVLGEAVGPNPYENFSYTDHIDTSLTTVELGEGTDVIYHITTAEVKYTQPSLVDVTVSEGGVIKAYTVTDDNSTEGFGASVNPQILNGELFVNHTADEIISLLGPATDNKFDPTTSDEVLHSGATYSNFYFAYAALFAAANYDTYLVLAGLEQELLFSEIYGESITAEAVDLSGLTTAVGNGTVNSVYSVAGTTDYIINVTALSNFPSAGAGSVTCWVVVETENGAVSGIKNVVIAGNVNQSYIDAGMIKDEALSHFTDIFDGSDFTIDDWKPSLTGSATYSTTAIIDAVNSAMNFVKANLTGGAGE